MKKAFAICVTLLFIVSLMNMSVFAAAEPIVVDFSTDPDNFEGISADGNWSYVNDGDKRVFFEECITGADPDDPDNGNGDVYGTLKFDPAIDAATYKFMKISLKNVSPYTTFEFHYGGDLHGIAAEACTHFPISANDTDYKTYVINVPDATVATYPVHPAIDFTNLPVFWEGNISDFRLDFAYDVEPGGRAAEGTKMYIEYIAFFDTKEAADAWTFKPAKGAVEETTKAPETQAPTEAATQAPQSATEQDSAATDSSADTTQSADNTSDTTGDKTWLLIGAGAVVAIAVIIIVISAVTRKKK
ncbi:MAG: hypothetical protein AB9835_07960 [Eubacteriales bacterium]